MGIRFASLLVSSQAYHLCCLFFVANLEALPKIHSLDSMMARNWKSLDYKEWELNQTKCFGGLEKKLVVLLMFVVLKSLQVLNSNVCDQIFSVLRGWGKMPHYRVNA